MGHHLIMGRRTFESLRVPLPGRHIIVLTRRPEYQAEGGQVAASLEKALELAAAAGEDEVFIGGGAEVYARALPLADRIYLTLLHARIAGDTFFPEIDLGCVVGDRARTLSTHGRAAPCVHVY